MKTEDRHFFGGYYLSDNGETIFGCRPYHCYPCGRIGERYLIFCLFSTDQLDDDPTGTVQESADMFPDAADYFCQRYPDVFDSLTPYATAVVEHYRSMMDDLDVVEVCGFLMHPDFAGKTFAEVCMKYPVQHTEITDEDGNVTKQPSHWRNSQEGI